MSQTAFEEYENTISWIILINVTIFFQFTLKRCGMTSNSNYLFILPVSVQTFVFLHA